MILQPGPRVFVLINERTARSSSINSKPRGSVYAWMCRSGIVASVRDDNKKEAAPFHRRTRSSNTWRAESAGLSRSLRKAVGPKLDLKHFKSSLPESESEGDFSSLFIYWQHFSRADHYGLEFITLCGEIIRRDTRFLPAHWFAVIRTPANERARISPIESGRERRWINYIYAHSLCDKCGCSGTRLYMYVYRIHRSASGGALHVSMPYG